jgi:hypothetical protein
MESNENSILVATSNDYHSLSTFLESKNFYMFWKEFQKIVKDDNNTDKLNVLDELLIRYRYPLPLVYFSLKQSFCKACAESLKSYWADWNIVEIDNNKGRSNKFNLPISFRGHTELLVVRANDWWNIDVVVDYFTEYERLNTAKAYTSSVKEKWEQNVSRRRLLEKYLSGKDKSMKEFRNVIFHGTKEVSTFRPTRCVGIITKILNCSNEELRGKRWLDICSGWGDRLFTACSLDMDYVGFDPNINLIPGHNHMIKLVGDSKKHVVHPHPFESQESNNICQMDIEKNGLFDFCLTSPPFFTIEKYNGPNQSTDSYPDLDNWLTSFLFTSLHQAWGCIKVGGYLIINIADINGVDMVSPMLYFVDEMLENSSWEGMLAFSGRATKKVPGVVYIWRKYGKQIKHPKQSFKEFINGSDTTFKDQYPSLYKKWTQT